MSQVHPDSASGESDVDEDDEVIAKDGFMEGQQQQADVQAFQTVPGYDNVRMDSALLPPPPTDKPVIKDANEPDFMSAPVISEESARQALLDYVESQCCWGSGAAKKFDFKELKSSTSYHYVLETFTEGRGTAWESNPYHGQFVDGPENGPAPGPWDIEASPACLFKDEVRFIQVPHTASVRACHSCSALGFFICSSCRGRGRKRCGRCRGRGRRRTRRGGEWVTVSCTGCHGSGKKRCFRCHGTGKVICITCEGQTRVMWFIKLTINWKNYTGSHIVEKTALPDSLIANVAGTTGFSDEQFRVLPVSRFPESEINEASHRLLQTHEFPTLRILMQRHVIRMVPVTECFYSYKDTTDSYFVYGLDCKVHAPSYPDTCCWGCTII